MTVPIIVIYEAQVISGHFVLCQGATPIFYFRALSLPGVDRIVFDINSPTDEKIFCITLVSGRGIFR